VTSIDDELIYTGDGGWTVDRRAGFEHDPYIGVGWRLGWPLSRVISLRTYRPFGREGGAGWPDRAAGHPMDRQRAAA
jgi:hypothetical protein